MNPGAELTDATWSNEGLGRLGRAAVSPGARPLSPDPGPNRHPVLAALPPDIRVAIYRQGHLRDVEVGSSLDPCAVTFVLSGAVGLFSDDRGGVCLGLAGPGSVVNAESLAGGFARERRVLVQGAVLNLQARLLTDILGRERTHRLLIEQLLGQQAALEREVICNALHHAGDRLARWLLMLDDVARGGPIHITQAALAEMLGVQRTSVNAAAVTLQNCGALRFVRGRVRILDPETVQARACACARVAVEPMDEPAQRERSAGP